MHASYRSSSRRLVNPTLNKLQGKPGWNLFRAGPPRRTRNSNPNGIIPSISSSSSPSASPSTPLRRPQKTQSSVIPRTANSLRRQAKAVRNAKRSVSISASPVNSPTSSNISPPSSSALSSSVDADAPAQPVVRSPVALFSADGSMHSNSSMDVNVDQSDDELEDAGQ